MVNNNRFYGKKRKKRLILVTAPPACGKTFVARQLARALKHVVYLDKDTLIILSRQIFKAAGKPFNRSSQFFEHNIRDYEYKAILALAMDALDYDDTVLINAPFTREVRNPQYISELRAQLEKKGAQLHIIWVVTDPQVCHQRMLRRNSDRDTWKLSHWDEYMARCDFSIPQGIGDPNEKNDLILFYNSNPQEFKKSLDETVAILQK